MKLLFKNISLALHKRLAKNGYDEFEEEEVAIIVFMEMMQYFHIVETSL